MFLNPKIAMFQDLFEESESSKFLVENLSFKTSKWWKKNSISVEIFF